MGLDESGYTDFDYLHLTEIFFQNKWIRHQANYSGFEVLWKDYKSEDEKMIIKKFILRFKYLTNEEVDLLSIKNLNIIINTWNLKTHDTIFVATKLGSSPDGSNSFMGYVKDILYEIDDEWLPHKLFTSIEEAKDFLLISPTKRSSRVKKIVLMDDFVGTGETANERIKHLEEDLVKLDIIVYFFALAGMEKGFELLKKNKRKYQSCIQLKKGTELCYESKDRDTIRDQIVKMETILSDKIKNRDLKDHSLGWGKSEALYSWTRFNIPNNVYPIFWWRKYKDNTNRKGIFNRIQ